MWRACLELFHANCLKVLRVSCVALRSWAIEQKATRWHGKAALWRVSWAALWTASIGEKPAKYTRHAPRIDAPMAAVRRWLRVEVLLAECEVLLMIDMARPFQVSG